MKKRMKKIRLNRETLRHLQTANLEHVAGGNTPLCTRAIFCSENPTCPRDGLRHLLVAPAETSLEIDLPFHWTRGLPPIRTRVPSGPPIVSAPSASGRTSYTSEVVKLL